MEFDPTTEEPLAALAFKIMSDKYVGRLTYLRVYSGSLKIGSQVTSEPRDQRAPASNGSGASPKCTRTSRIPISTRHGRRRHRRRESALAPSTGHTVCPDTDKLIALESIKFPEPVIQIAIEPKSSADKDTLGAALGEPRARGPHLPRLESTPRRARRSFSAWGELHLEIIVDRLNREFGVQANQGKPQVAYRETVRTQAKGERVRYKFVPPDGRLRPTSRPSLVLHDRSSRATATISSDSNTLAVRFRRKVHPGDRKGRARGDVCPACSPAIRSSTGQGRRCRTGPTTRSTRTRAPSRSPDRSPSRKPRRTPTRCSSEPVMAVEVTTPEDLPRRRDRQPQQPPGPHRNHRALARGTEQVVYPQRAAPGSCPVTPPTCAR